MKVSYSEDITLQLLRYQDTCPKCGVNWTAIGEDIFYFQNGEARWQALIIIDNCDVCKVRFRRERRL